MLQPFSLFVFFSSGFIESQIFLDFTKLLVRGVKKGISVFILKYF